MGWLQGSVCAINPLLGTGMTPCARLALPVPLLGSLGLLGLTPLGVWRKEHGGLSGHWNEAPGANEPQVSVSTSLLNLIVLGLPRGGKDRSGSSGPSPGLMPLSCCPLASRGGQEHKKGGLASLSM